MRLVHRNAGGTLSADLLYGFQARPYTRQNHASNTPRLV
jgi:hypothetical protein